MTIGRSVAIQSLFGVALLAAGCVARPRTMPDSARHDMVILLPDADSGVVGRAVVSNSFGTVELAGAGAATTVGRAGAPSPVRHLDEAERRRLSDTAFAALPPPSQHVVLNFQFDSDELTDASRAQLPEILLAVKQRPVPEVFVIGHTDTIGTSASNIALGLKRADLIRRLLLEIGLEPSLIETASHGEADLLVRTGDEVAEPRNRRVEITVR